jgi:hypothetical protein
MDKRTGSSLSGLRPISSEIPGPNAPLVIRAVAGEIGLAAFPIA